MQVEVQGAAYLNDILGTDHVDFDYEMIRESAKLIVDTRGMYRGKHKNVVNA